MAQPIKELPSKTCEHCGKNFSRRRFGKRLEDATRFKSRRFCTKHCASFRTEVGRSNYLKQAGKLRKTACENCGATTKLNAHHKDGDIMNNSPNNIETLCQSCHMKYHWRLRKRGIVYGSHRKFMEAKKLPKTDLNSPSPNTAKKG